MTTLPRRKRFVIGDHTIPAGHRARFELPIARLMSGTPVALPVIVVHGRNEGPTVWLSGAIHGDELCGVEIIRQVLSELDAKSMSGTVIAVPIVNVHGFNTGHRYLPDRRDLNRSFPGSARGSLASRVAHLLMKEVVSRSSVGIDLHTGSDHRTNLPQIRADLDDPETRKLAEAFGPPLMLHAKIRDGSLRGAATEQGSTVLLYEGGEALRFDGEALSIGVAGIRRVLAALDMVDADDDAPRPVPVESRRGYWVRARRSGIALIDGELGEVVRRGQLLGVIHDSVGTRLSQVNATHSGVIIGRVQQPLVNQGDALIHIAEVGADDLGMLGQYVSTTTSPIPGSQDHQ
jgi:predicted deacylase